MKRTAHQLLEIAVADLLTVDLAALPLRSRSVADAFCQLAHDAVVLLRFRRRTRPSLGLIALSLKRTLSR